MTWVRLDDTAPDHPKLVGLGDDAFALWTRALCYAARHLTDGRIPIAALPLLSRSRRPAAVAKSLVLAGLWAEAEGGFQIHDYADYNPTAARVRAERDGWAARQQRSRDSRRDTPPQSRACHAVTPPVSHSESHGPVTPSRPDPVPVPIPSPDPDLTHTPRAHEEPPASQPTPAPPPSANSSLLPMLAALVAEGNTWAISVEGQRQEKLGRLTEPQKKRLREIGLERAAPKARAWASPAPSSTPAISLQRPAKPGEHTWTAGEEHTF